MRVLSLLALLLLSYSAVAQTASPYEWKKTFPQDQVSQPRNFSISGKTFTPPAGVLPNYPATCFFIRSYNFERQGTEAPRLKNMTTCTPAKSDQFRQTAKPKVKLIPANE